jgi:tetratricopeptide (TPR) repeat protein
LLPPSEQQGDVLCELGSACHSVGDNARRRGALEQALDVAEAIGSRRIELRAQVELAQAGLYGAGGLHTPPQELLDAASEAIPVFEELGDDRALGRTWLAVADVHALRLNNRARAEAAATALRHYRRTGFSPSLCLTTQAAALYFGATPVGDALDRCAELLEEAAGDRFAAASVVMYAAGLRAMRGAFADARRGLDDAHTSLEDLGASFSVDGPLKGMRAAVERLAGDLEAAALLLRESRTALERTGEADFAATRSAQLADVLLELGRAEESERFAELARSGSNAEDLMTESYWRSVRARLLARRGRVGEAESLGRAALDLLADTDMHNHRAKAILDLASVVRSSRQEKFTTLVHEAVRLYQRKGNVVGVAAAQSMLAGALPTRR